MALRLLYDSIFSVLEIKMSRINISSEDTDLVGKFQSM